MNIFWWLHPGVRIKRWVGLICIGLMFLAAGSAIAAYSLAKPEIPAETSKNLKIYSSVLIIGGTLGILFGVVGLVQSLMRIVKAPSFHRKLSDVAYEQATLSRGLKVVAFGGGTGLSNLLFGLKNFTSEITAVTTMSDDGGSSGRLRMDLDMPPPGDIRNCLVALAETEPLMGKLFQYRFEKSELAGHSFGNLFLTALTKITGDFDQAIREATRILAVRGKVIPSCNRRVSLVAVHEDDTKSTGQKLIANTTKKINKIELRPDPGPVRDEILTAIREADIILYGPGSLFTSVLPNLVLNGIGSALERATAHKIYICNIVDQVGETSNFSVSDHVEALLRHIPKGALETVIVNSGELIKKDPESKDCDLQPVKLDIDKIESNDLDFVLEDLVSATFDGKHDPHRLARTIFDYVESKNKK